ncbi:Glycosyl transferases group 1 [Rhizobium sp. RU20A]|uniref:glycosyltransferase n=1 Tax=Rhizobium sp. RU20A TaxID=1907412 RepID=UPI000953D086|nr:glycosyltransferase [Rhizobium sp. RU20A]SIQ54969.1 Glycosyl transferases group 1 [Rhizobium sp. RU20A]
MHLVFVTSLVPVENPSSGFDIANRAVYEGLVALGHQVSVLGFAGPADKPLKRGDVHLLGRIEVTNARVDAWRRATWLLGAFAANLPVSVAKMRAVDEADLRAAIDGLGPIDGFVLNSVQLPGAFLNLFRSTPTLYVAHNIEAATARENAERAQGRLSRVLFSRESRLLAGIEARLTHEASWVFTFSEGDRLGFGPAVAAKSCVLPLVTRWEAPADLPAVPGSATHDLGLIGTWSWEANRIGLDWFVGEVVPLLPPHLTIAVAGEITSPPKSDHPGLRFVGRVPDADAFLASTRLVPLVARAGSGVQLKTIETFERGLPCVATPASVRGIETLPALCRVAETPEAFADTIIALLGAPGLAPDADAGRLFHAEQKTRLQAALATGLSHLDRVGVCAPTLTRPSTPNTPAPAADSSFAPVARLGGY